MFSFALIIFLHTIFTSYTFEAFPFKKHSATPLITQYLHLLLFPNTTRKTSFDQTFGPVIPQIP